MRGARNTARSFGMVILLPLAIIVLAAAFPAGAQSTEAAPSSAVENVRVTDPSSGFPYQAETRIEIDGQGRIFAGWKEMNEIGGGNRVGFGRSLDGGRTWERSLAEVAAGESQSDPWLAVDESGRVITRDRSLARVSSSSRAPMTAG